jgi:hypothetical protein
MFWVRLDWLRQVSEEDPEHDQPVPLEPDTYFRDENSLKWTCEQGKTLEEGLGRGGTKKGEKTWQGEGMKPNLPIFTPTDDNRTLLSTIGTPDCASRSL